MQTECNLMMPEHVLLLKGVCYPRCEYVKLRANKTLESLSVGAGDNHLSLPERRLEFGPDLYCLKDNTL